MSWRSLLRDIIKDSSSSPISAGKPRSKQQRNMIFSLRVSGGHALGASMRRRISTTCRAPRTSALRERKGASSSTWGAHYIPKVRVLARRRPRRLRYCFQEVKFIEKELTRVIEELHGKLNHLIQSKRFSLVYVRNEDQRTAVLTITFRC